MSVIKKVSSFLHGLKGLKHRTDLDRTSYFIVFSAGVLGEGVW